MDESRVRLTSSNIDEWFALGGSAFLFDVYASVVFLTEGLERSGQAIHLKVSARDVRQATGLVEGHLRGAGHVREGYAFRIVEALIDRKPADNEVPAGVVEVVAMMNLNF